METLFDHRPTAAELKEVLGADMSKADYEKEALDADTENGRIYRLYMIRDNLKEAEKFLAQIQDEQYRFDVALVDVH